MFIRRLAMTTTFLLTATSIQAQTVYQGQLKLNGLPVTGLHSLNFRLFDMPDPGGTLLQDVSTTGDFADGLVTVPVDFNAVHFSGAPRWLELEVDGVTLLPRQKLSFAPYSTFSARPWATSGTNISYSAGLVGIGTTTPPARVTVQEDHMGAQSDFTHAVDNAGVLISTFRTIAPNFTPGVFWRTSNSAADKPKAGINLHVDGNGSEMHFGTSNDFTTGITNDALVIDPSGNVGIGTSSPEERLSVVDRIGIHEFTSGGAELRFKDGTSVPDGLFRLRQSGGAFRIEENTSAIGDFSTVNQILYADNGNIGIGTASPAERLDLGGETDGTTIQIGAYTAIGERFSAGATVLGDNVKPADASNIMIQMTSHPSYGGRAIEMDFTKGIAFHATAGSATAGTPFSSEVMRITNGGNVGIGTVNPTSKLTVCGDIRAVGNISASGTITATVAGACPDFVFNDDYARMGPDELRAYLVCHKHLPHMPSAAQIERDGLDLGASQMSLLQTTEELTLDMLDQHAALQAEQAKIEQQCREVEGLRRASAQKDAEIADLRARLEKLEALVNKAQK